MEFKITTVSASQQSSACTILPVYSSGTLPKATKSMDSVLGGRIKQLISSGDFSGAPGETMLLTDIREARSERILLVGCGNKKSFDTTAYKKALSSAWAAISGKNHTDATCYLSLESVSGADAYRRARLAAEIWHHETYRYTATKSAANKKPGQKYISVAADSRHSQQARKGLTHGDAIGKGMSFCRELGNLPANICTPSYLVKQARQIEKSSKRVSLQVLNESDMKKLGMGALLSVTAGTEEPAKLLVLKYTGATSKKPPVVLVGKGITFDSGGISLKPGHAMDEMKYDMGGAASVLGAMHAIAAIAPSINLVVIVPTCENMPSGTATKPGDVVTSMAGLTIEILNTDAEGRLILCDALTYAARFKPAAIVDVATLTGACVIALGKHRSGLLSNSDKLANTLLKSGIKADDRAWRLPIAAEYMKQLDSNFADMANIGGRDAGTITAACFLSRFTENENWAHIDIAGTAWQSGKAKGSTGRPVPLLVEFLLNG